MLVSTGPQFTAWDTARWPNFSVAELQCKCAGAFCQGEYWHDTEFLDALQALRDHMRRPLVITSGHRCSEWNDAVGGAPNSMHKQIAIDISLHGHNRHTLLKEATAQGFTGIGLAATFLHLDRRKNSARWYYRGSYDLWQTSSA